MGLCWELQHARFAVEGMLAGAVDCGSAWTILGYPEGSWTVTGMFLVLSGAAGSGSVLGCFELI